MIVGDGPLRDDREGWPCVGPPKRTHHEHKGSGPRCEQPAASGEPTLLPAG
jgi:hypothetical protein